MLNYINKEFESVGEMRYSMMVIADLCSDDASCGDHASCVWSDENLGKECECDPGYVLDYKICIKQGKSFFAFRTK